MPIKVNARASESEKHEFDVNALLFHNGKLYSGADDGKIKIWTPTLTKIAEVQSNRNSVFSLAASEDTLYACSSDGTIKCFDLETLKEKSILYKKDKTEFYRIKYVNGFLYSGDNEGNITIFKKDKFYSSFNIREPVKDMEVYNNFLFTIKDLDILISNMKLDGPKLEYDNKIICWGGAPISLIGDKLFCFVNREGMDIIVHENNVASQFKGITKVVCAHDKIINTLCGTVLKNKNVLFSGGWDKRVKKWIVDEDIVKQDCYCDVNMIVNTIKLGDGAIYVGGTGGNIVRMEIE